jgi:hypothetical protein
MNRNTLAVSGLFLIAATLGITLLYEPVESETDNAELSNFQSEQDFIDYMSRDRDREAYSSGSQEMAAKTGSDASGASGAPSSDAPQRAGSTQEADWIQTRENRILISHGWPRHFNSVEIPGLELEHNVSGAGGPMVTSGNLTVVEEQERIVAYDGEMNEEWELGLESYVEEMTRSGDQLILLTRETDSQCPIRPFDGAEIACTSILRPGYMGQNDYTYTVSRIDIETGEEQESKSFVASSTAQVEVTSEKTYISYSDRKPEHEIMTDFLLNEASISSETRERVEELQGYDLTDRSMQIEIEAAIREHENEDMEELEEEFSEYDEENMRSYEDSILMTLNNSDLSHEEQSFDGRISGIETEEEALLTVEYNGVDYENRAREIRLLEGESTEIEGDAQLFNDSILVREDEEIRLLDTEMNEVNSVEIQALNIETSGDRILASVRPEDREETERENRVVLFDSELERLDSETIDSWSLYSFNLVKGEESSYSLVHGYNSTYLMEVGQEINLYETEASGQLVYQGGLYTVGEKVQKLSENGEVEEELDLKIPRNYVPLPEPMPR